MSLRDVERFKRQKVKDLKDVFTNYAILQIDRCKKVRTVVYEYIVGPQLLWPVLLTDK